MNEKKKTFFSFTKMNKYYIIPFITPLFCFTCNFLYKSLRNESNELDLFFFQILYSISDIIAGLIYFTHLSEIKNGNLNSKIIKSKKKNKSKIFCIIIFMALLICSKCFFDNQNKELFLFLPFSLNLILSIIFSKFLLKINLYNHQILSIIISFIGFFLILFSNLQITLEKFYIYIIISLLNATFISTLKYSTTIYFISPFLCSFLYGIISFIMCVIGNIIYDLYNFNKFSLKQKFDVFHGKMFIIYFLLIIFVSIILKVLILLEVYYFSPILYFISESISRMLYLFYSKLYLETKEKKIFIYIFIIIGSLFEIISILLYNEIIIINYFGLNKNTVKCIKEREIEEKTDVLYNFEEEDKDDLNNSNLYFEISNYKFNLDSRTS
jgi:hypothetical protein